MREITTRIRVAQRGDRNALDRLYRIAYARGRAGGPFCSRASLE
jgi:hypothetical protein